MSLGLDKDQLQCVDFEYDKPLIIKAGPGSGKTGTIVSRVERMLKVWNKNSLTYRFKIL